MFKHYVLNGFGLVSLFAHSILPLHANYTQNESAPFISATRQIKAADQMTRNGVHNYKKALEAKEHNEKLKHTLQFMRDQTSGYINGNQSSLRYLINGSGELCKNPKIRKEIRRERKKAQNNTLSTKSFKKMQVLALNNGLLTQAIEQIFSKDASLQTKGQKNFVRGLNNLLEVNDPDLQKQKISVASLAFEELKSQALSKQIAFDKQFVYEISHLGSMLLERTNKITSKK